MKYFKWVIMSLLFISNMACANDWITIKLTVVDENSKPIEGAYVTMGFRSNRKNNDFRGLTDKKGQVKATSDSIWGVRLYVTKKGYYSSEKEIGKKSQALTLTLRPIKNQVAMITKKEDVLLPKKGKKYAYDFKHGDLVVPHGEGLTAHIYFEVNGNSQGYFNYDEKFEITFPNQYDGLIKYDINDDVIHESGFKFPYLAPPDGYNNKLTHKDKRWQNNKVEPIEMFKEETYDRFMLGYIFRVNTKVDDQGNIISANYGRFSDEIMSSVFPPIDAKEKSAEGRAYFTYYYNPKANERSMEIDYGKLTKLERKTYKNIVKKTK